jgi:hypothetical protein
MNWLSDAWDSAKDAVSSGWDSVKDTVKDVTGVDSINSLLLTGGLAMVPANLSGKGVLGEALTTAMNPLLQPYGQGIAPQMMYGPLNQPAPSNLTMGAGAAPAPQVVQSPSNLSSLFGNSGYSFGPSETSAALLAPNNEAYQFSPLARGLS